MWATLHIIFLHSPLATQCICYIVQLVSVFLRRRSFSAALVVFYARCWWPTRTTFNSNTCSTRLKIFPPTHKPFVDSWCCVHTEPTYDGEFPQVSLLLPKETAQRHDVLRWRNVAKERPSFRPRCCHSTECRVLYCTWLSSSTGTVNTAQCGSFSLSRLPRNLEMAFTFRFTLVNKKDPMYL